MGDPADRRPNVLIIVVDCLRADRCPIGKDAGKLKLWPKLCRRGTAFTQMISTATTTTVCFGSLLTGQYSFVHALRSIRTESKLDPAVPTLQGICKQAGYRTYARLTGPLLEILGLNAGFDEYEHRDQHLSLHEEWGRGVFDQLDGGMQAPWLLLLHLFEVHRPRHLNGLEKPRSRQGEYDLCWQQLDARLDSLVEKAPANTLVLLTADHGEYYYRRSDRTFWGHIGRKLRENFSRPRRMDDWKGHGFHVFEDLVRIPCVLAGPGVPAGRVVDQQVRQIDLMPTLVDVLALGADRPRPTHGRSLAPAMRGEAMAEESAFIESGYSFPARHWHGLREPGWKYAERPRWSENIDLDPLLYDLKADPLERRNVVYDHPEIALRMRRTIDELLAGGPDAHGPAGTKMNAQEQDELDKHLRALGYI